MVFGKTMMKLFWTNTIWYILLGATTVFQILFSIIKASDRKFASAFYMTLAGLVLFFETGILIIFRAYTYYPKIILTSPFDDALAGNLFSQFSVSSTALVVAVFNLKYYWILLFAAIYGLIEELFLALGIYSHNWYQTWMTFVGLTVYFLWAKKTYAKNLGGISLLRKNFYIILGLFPMDVVTLLWGFILSGFQNYTRSFFPDQIGSPYVVGVLYYLIVAVTLVLIYQFKLKLQWKFIGALTIYGINYIAYKMHIFYFFNNSWYLIFTTVFIVSMYLSIVFLDRLFDKEADTNSGL